MAHPLFFFNDPATTEIYTLSLHDALPISRRRCDGAGTWHRRHPGGWAQIARSEEHTSELQSQSNLVCRLLLEKKKKRGGVQRGHRVGILLLGRRALARAMSHSAPRTVR